MTIPTDVRATFAEAAPHENSNFRTQPTAPSPIGFLSANPDDAGASNASNAGSARPALLEKDDRANAPHDAHDGAAE